MNLRRRLYHERLGHVHGLSGLMVAGLIVTGTVLWAYQQPGPVIAFSGSERHVTAEFNGAEATTVFGGYQLNLRGAEMRGHSAVLKLDTIFGGAEITVPKEWNVVYEGRALFGGFQDRTRHPFRDESRGDLIIEGLTLFGGMQVKN